MGLTLSVHLSKNFYVTGVDGNHEIVSSLSNGKPGFFEEGLDRSLEEAILRKRIDFTDSIPAGSYFAVVITVGTPLVNGGLSEDDLFEVMNQINELGVEAALIVLRSTVSVGTTARLQKEFPRYLITYCPERTIEGKALHELTSLPQLIGADSEESRRLASDLFRECGVSEIVETKGSREAEFAKLASNTYRDSVFALANEMALAATVLGVDAINAISSANQNYSRSNIPFPGPSGGPCLTKDPHMLAGVGDWPSPIRESRALNSSLVSRFLNLKKDVISSSFNPKGRKIVLILGLSFKGNPITSDTRGSSVPEISDWLRTNLNDVEIIGYDPHVTDTNPHDLGLDRISLDLSLESPSLVIIQHNGSWLKSEMESLGRRQGSVNLVVDFWDVSPQGPDIGFRRIALGR